jgi:type II secretory pathway pseudopilin PulG
MNRRLAAFTLVEVLAALAFLGLVIPVTIRGIQVANRAAEVSERSLTAVQLGENKLGELMLANAWTTAESRGTFSDDQPGYRWELKKGDWQTGAMSELTLDVFYPVQGVEQSLRLSTLVNEDLIAPTTP